MMRRAAVAATAVLLLSILVAASNNVTICHHPGPLDDPFGQHPFTITVDGSAVAAHLRHGDTIGPCGQVTPTPRPTPKPTPRYIPPTPKPTPRPTQRPGQTQQPRAVPSSTVPPTDA